MFELIYYSIASPSLNKDDVANILKVSQENNLINGITGCMLYHKDAFLQILEGDRKVVEFLYHKIERDVRHYNVRLVYESDKEERLFENWSMAFLDLDKNNAPDKDKLLFRESFITISNQTEHVTVAGELFWNISKQIIND